MIDDEIYDVDAQSKTASRYLHEHGLFTESRLIDALLREKEKLLDQLEAAQKDAARYQWLKSRNFPEVFETTPGKRWVGTIDEEWEEERGRGDTPDAAIDAAMASQS